MKTIRRSHFTTRADDFRTHGCAGHRHAFSQHSNHQQHRTIKSILLATSVLVLVFAAGCKPTTQKAAVPSAKTTTQQLDKALREQTAALSKQLDQAKSATESTWEELKAGFNKGLTELKDGFNQARQWTSEKIAP